MSTHILSPLFGSFLYPFSLSCSLLLFRRRCFFGSLSHVLRVSPNRSVLCRYFEDVDGQMYRKPTSAYQKLAGELWAQCSASGWPFLCGDCSNRMSTTVERERERERGEISVSRLSSSLLPPQLCCVVSYVLVCVCVCVCAYGCEILGSGLEESETVCV